MKKFEMEENKDVHTEHCCVKHGCKYGHEDCTVYTKQKMQSYPCEDCEYITPESKVVYILRSVSGAGKSTLAEKLIENTTGIICCADDYFTQDGNYNFDASKLGEAHNYSRKLFDSALFDFHTSTIVVSNTNTKLSDWIYYEDTAKKHGALVFFIVVENRHTGKNVHGVPQETLFRQEHNIKSTLKLA